MYNPEKLATVGKLDKTMTDKTKDTTQYVLDTTMRRQTQTT